MRPNQKYTAHIATAMTLVFCFMTLGSANAQQYSGEPLLEVPIHKIPQGMTLHDYEDANRRISMGMFYAITPGGMHFYADESQTGWVLLGTVAGGFAAIIAASQTARDVTQVNNEFETTTIGPNTYYKIPVETTGANNENATYRLKRVETSRKGLTDTGAALAATGVLAIFGSYVWDIFHGIRVIEKKRSLARYKFGRLNAAQTTKRNEKAPSPIVELKPMVDPQQGAGGLQIDMRF